MSISSKETADHLAEILKEVDSFDYLVNPFFENFKSNSRTNEKIKNNKCEISQDTNFNSFINWNSYKYSKNYRLCSC